MKGAVLIDAHNLLHQDPDLRRLLGTPEAARRALERRLAKRRDCWLFYDGGPGGEARSAVRGTLRLDYSGTGEADDRIVAWLRAHPASGATVVSDDRELRARARTLGARLMSAREFLAGLDPGTVDDPAKPDAPDDAEVRFWLREFGED
ncbi:MAG TPA: NYN domain-containing protein [Planctomycetota bacterium]|nr:NYN domain-containing protein [Planctomycetota bacterium]